MYQRFIFSIFFFLIFLNGLAQPIRYGNNPKAGKYATINGIKLYYETYGTGIPLLLLHGNSGNIAAFENQIPFFEKRFKVIAVYSRLQGKSGGNADTLSYDMMANDFCSLINYLQLDSVFVLGWSDGGINAILMAMHCGSKIKKLAFTGANLQPDTTAFSETEINNTKAVVENKNSSKLEKTLNKMMLNEPHISFTSLSSISLPVLVMAGDHDLVKPEHTLRIFQSLPKGQLCIFPNAHHGVCQQYPALFNKIVLNFFMDHQ